MDKTFWIILFLFGIFLYILSFTIKIKKDKNKYIEKWKQQAQQEFDQESHTQRESLKNEIQQKQNELTEVLRAGQVELSGLNLKCAEVKREISEKESFNSSLLKIREEELDRLIEEKKKTELLRLQNEVEEWAQSAQEAAEFRRDQILNEYQNNIDKKDKELSTLQSEIEEYRTKRNAINKEILKQRALEEKQDFYRVQIPDSYKEDIHYLISIIDRFYNKEIIYKLIWSEYLQKPFKTMLNHVLNNREPKNVIYMIQNIKSKEIYIGKTKAEVSKRWTEHIKTSLNIGTISRSNIHKALFNHWDDFTFSVLEEVPLNSNLNEREKFYISFYQSDIYGYNIKAGG